MTNYIQKLQKENTDLKTQLDSSRMEISEFIKFLISNPKFHNTETENKNWISVPDVLDRLNEIRNKMFIEE
jgi:hypothetical protein